MNAGVGTNSGRRRFPRLVGGLLVAISVVYLVVALKKALQGQERAIGQLVESPYFAASIGMYLVWAAVSHMSFFCNLRSVGVEISMVRSFAIIGASSIGKYLPGNVGHFLGRFYVAGKFNIGKDRIAASIFAEIVQAIIAGLLVGLPAIGMLVAALRPHISVSLLIGAGLLVIVGAGLLVFRKRIRKGIAFTKERVCQVNWLWAASALGITILVMIVNGLAFASLLSAQVPLDSAVDVVGATACNSISWLLGFLTPGAPGGVGIREAVLDLSLNASLGMENVALAVVASRIIAIATEGVTFGASFCILMLYEKKEGRPNDLDIHPRDSSSAD